MVQRRSWWPIGLLAVGLSLLAAWMLRVIAPPSLVRDGQRLPVGMASQHAAVTGHHAGEATGAPSPIIEEAVPHFVGGAFLAIHLIALALAVGIPVIRRLLARLRLPQNKFLGQLLLAMLAAVTTGLSVVVAARFGYGDRLAFRDAVLGGVEVARYAFILAIAVVVIFGVPSNPQVRSNG